MIPPLPPRISGFMQNHHVLALAIHDDDGPWAANCFYALEEANVRLLILSSTDTRHGAAMLQRASVAGAISGQPQTVREIQGVQFTACAERLEGVAREKALEFYFQRHPMARGHDADIWSLMLDSIKFTDNSIAFGHKTLWQRNG